MNPHLQWWLSSRDRGGYSFWRTAWDNDTDQIIIDATVPPEGHVGSIVSWQNDRIPLSLDRKIRLSPHTWLKHDELSEACAANDAWRAAREAHLVHLRNTLNKRQRAAPRPVPIEDLGPTWAPDPPPSNRDRLRKKFIAARAKRRAKQACLEAVRLARGVHVPPTSPEAPLTQLNGHVAAEGLVARVRAALASRGRVS